MSTPLIRSTAVRIHRDRIAHVVAGLALACASACSADVEGSDAAGSTASATALQLVSSLNAALPASSEAVVAWNVTSGPEDYAYVWGRAALSDGKFVLALASPPPAEAINSYGLAVGLILVVPQSAAITDGRQSEEDEDKFEQVLAASERHAIIYVDHARANAAFPTAQTPWLLEFQQGYSCGVGKEAAPGETFDSYVPTPCETVQIRAGNGDFDFPNWT